MPTQTFTWTDQNPACKATYQILAALMQLKAEFKPAGQLTVDRLTYFPKVSPAPAVLDAHASQMAWQYCDRLLKLTRVKESPSVTLNQFIRRFETLFGVGTTTLKDIAQAADDFLVFPGEK